MGTCVSPLQSAESPKDVNKVMARFVIRDKARLLTGKAQIVEQGRYVMWMIRDAEAALDEVLNAWCEIL
jgi:hypothetical protein